MAMIYNESGGKFHIHLSGLRAKFTLKSEEKPMNSTYHKIISLAKKNKGYIQTKDLVKQDLLPKYLGKMVEEGYLEKIRHGIYRLTDIEIDMWESFIEANLAVPNGVIFLLSAMDYHQLSTINPVAVHMAVQRNNYVAPPDFLNLKLYSVSPQYLEIGVKIIFIRGIPVRIYDIEKTICDCLKYRNKIGIDLVNEAIRNYMKSEKKDFRKMSDYAKKCRIKSVYDTYMAAFAQ